MSFLTYLREAITNNGGKGGDNRGNRRRSSRRRYSNGQENHERQNRSDRPERARPPLHERPRWIPPKISTEPLPSPACPCCGKPIRDIAAAVTDRESGQAAHFDCVIARVAERETLEKGDVVSYIGGGRFGIVRFSNPGEPKKFIIKKILEWENKDERPEWRSLVSEHYSAT